MAAAPSYFNEDLNASSSSQTSPSSSLSTMGHRPPGHRGVVSPQPSAAGDNGYNGYNDDEDGVDDSQIMDESMNLSLSELQDAAARAQVSCVLWMMMTVEGCWIQAYMSSSERGWARIACFYFSLSIFTVFL